MDDGMAIPLREDISISSQRYGKRRRAGLQLRIRGRRFAVADENESTTNTDDAAESADSARSS